MIELYKPKPAKCDFCGCQAVGYGLMQCVFFCKEHERQAEEVEQIMVAELEQFLDEVDNSHGD